MPRHEPLTSGPGVRDADGRRRAGWLTWPNLLTCSRIVGSVVLFILAGLGQETLFFWLLGVMLLTDWLDGRLAILLDQCSVIGARLDSIADALMYSSLLFAVAMLRPEFAQRNSILIAVMMTSYAVSVFAALFRFGRLPAYHTWAAKMCWVFILGAAITIFARGPDWPAWLAMSVVILTNIEETLITMALPAWRADVRSIFTIRRRSARGRTSPAAGVGPAG